MENKEMNGLTEGIEQTEDQEQTVLNVFDEALNGMNELEAQEQQEEKEKVYEWATEDLTVRAFLKRYAEHKIVVPDCQRLYVWDEKKRASLHHSVKKNLPCGVVILAEYKGKLYLIDGLQRTTSLLMLSSDKTFTTEQKKQVLDYKLKMMIVYDMTPSEMAEYFATLNSGIALASAVKERSKLSSELNELILSISGHEFFRTISESANATFNKSHHHELIALNTLLAVSNIAITDNKAKSLCTAITENAEIIKQKKNEAIAMVERLQNIYNNITDKDVVKRSMNANFIGVLVHVLAKTEKSDESICKLINYIFAEKRAVKAYSETTSNGAGDITKCTKRYNVLLDLLNNSLELEEINETAYKNFLKQYDDEPLKAHSDKHIIIDIADLEECEKKALFKAYRDNKQETWDKIIINCYKVLESRDV